LNEFKEALLEFEVLLDLEREAAMLVGPSVVVVVVVGSGDGGCDACDVCDACGACGVCDDCEVCGALCGGGKRGGSVLESG
jgi:hypothetical protein